MAEPRGRVTEWDREYMRRLARFKRESHEIARAEHLKRPLRERVVRSMDFCIRARPVANLIEEGDSSEAFYHRARLLGLLK